MRGSSEGHRLPSRPGKPGDPRDSASDRAERALTTARRIGGALVLGVVLLTLVSGSIPPAAGLGFLVGPAGILGIVSPAIGYRLYHLLRERVPAAANSAARHDRFVRAIAFALGVTTATAVLGVITFAWTGELSALIGLVTHMILTGALWPSEDRLAAFTAAVPQGPHEA